MRQDEVLGADGRYSRTLQKHACRLGATSRSRWRKEHLWEMLGVQVWRGDGADDWWNVTQGHAAIPTGG